jgi:alkylation response protein AidB-like acyl-CoA dehydrogenase
MGPVSAALRHGVAALASEQVGGAERALEMAVDYATVRYQFGRPIGSFQAVKHRCASMLVELELARSAASYAAWTVANNDDDALIATSLAKAYCSEAFCRVAADNIQVHGGVGFTWEHPAHLYLKRAKSSSLLFGDPYEHRQRLSQELGLAGAPSSAHREAA